MDKKIHSGIMLTLLLISMLAMAFGVGMVSASLPVHNIDTGVDYATIQEAIDAPETLDGHTILIDAGTYVENVIVNKGVALVGEGPNTTVIDGNYIKSVVKVTANNVKIANFTLRNSSTESPMVAANSGILIYYANNCTITHNNIINNKKGICIYSSHNNSLTGNNVTKNAFGIELDWSSNNNVADNILSEQSSIGIYIVWSSNNNMISQNNVTSSDWCGVRLSRSNNNTVSQNKVEETTGNGIALAFVCSNNTITQNIVLNNERGIRINRVENNTFYFNNFINNTQQVHIVTSGYANFWDDGYPSGGNYWSDYEDRYPDAGEIDDSGIWNTPYVIDENNQDNYPLMEPYSPLPRTIDELQTEIEELGSEGEIDNQGVVTSLLAKLNAAQKLIEDGKIDQAKIILNAFINEVQAQSGKHITPEAAELLIESAEHILSNL